MSSELGLVLVSTRLLAVEAVLDLFRRGFAVAVAVAVAAAAARFCLLAVPDRVEDRVDGDGCRSSGFDNREVMDTVCYAHTQAKNSSSKPCECAVKR